MHMKPRRVCSLVLVLGTLVASVAVAEELPEARPRIGLALGGGSARGIAHIGVLEWLEQQRIPVDVIAGTSMGGLIGGAYATGMSPAEIREMLRDTNWDTMFLGESPFEYKTYRRKQDARAYPSPLEIGWRKGFKLPSGLEPGQQIDLLLTRMTLSYYDLAAFDELPTPFRCVATDVRRAESVVLEKGSLARALRATMAMPAVFGPVELDGRLLVDGGLLNNVPADIAREMGADIVIAVDVGVRSDPTAGSESMFSLLSKTIDTMMAPNTRRSLETADIVIHPDVEGVGSADWRKSDAIADVGYVAADCAQEALRRLALDPAAYEDYRAARAARRRTALPAPQFIVVDGVPPRDQRWIQKLLWRHVGRPLDAEQLSEDITQISGTDRYETVVPDLVQATEGIGLRIRVVEKSYGPPFISLALDLDNTTSAEFTMNIRSRITAYDLAGAGSEARFDVGLGTGIGFGAEIYRPFGGSPWFIAPRAAFMRSSVNGYRDEEFVSEYRTTQEGVGIDLGLNTNQNSQLRIGYDVGRVDLTRRIGDPLLPEISGREAFASVRWDYDGQDSPSIASHGMRMTFSLRRFFDAGDATFVDSTPKVSEDEFTSGEAYATWFKLLGTRYYLYFQGSGGSSFGDHPLPPNDFTLGGPLRLGAFNNDELRGSNYALAGVGLFRRIGRLPDFLGGNIYVGGVVENGSAFEKIDEAKFRTNFTAILLMDTFLGPAFAGGSVGTDGRGRFYVGVSPLFH